MFGYFHTMRTCHAKLRYFDWDGQVHFAEGKTGEQQGDPFDMLIFNLTTPHLDGSTLLCLQSTCRLGCLLMLTFIHQNQDERDASGLA